MIKAKGRHKGRDVIVLGLSEGNIVRLREGKPIHIFREEMNIPFDVIIMWGETEEAMSKQLIGPETVVRGSAERPKRN